jgi:beta-aspartyl-peptidase (threonine type)
MKKPDTRCAVAVHGGAGNSPDTEDGCIAAAQRAFDTLRSEGDCLRAVVEAVTHLENDGRFNAGRGAEMGMDGHTIEMDASLMDSRGLLAAVAAVRNVRNPILLAHAVSRTPHRLVAGEGAERLARVCGLARSEPDLERVRQSYRETAAKLAKDEPSLPLANARRSDFEQLWNYATPWDEAVKKHAHGTVGAVARDAQGHFAVATSTGGSMPSLLGRVGDTPLIGCGFYCGARGAVGVTGIGEVIIPELVAYRVYQWIADGVPLQQALDNGVDLFDDDVEVGIIGITIDDVATASNRPMPVAIKEF